MRIEQGEVADYDGDWERNSQYPQQSTQRPHKHTHVRLWRHVSVPHGCHSNDSPPQSNRNGREIVIRIILNSFRIKYQSGKNHNAQHKEKH